MSATRRADTRKGLHSCSAFKQRHRNGRPAAGVRRRSPPPIDPLPPVSDAAKPPVLTAATFKTAWQNLAARDGDLARAIERFGPPPMWRRKPCFATLVRIILEQQVSLSSARAAFNRLRAMVVPFSAAAYTRLDESALRGAGITRQKRVYTRALAEDWRPWRAVAARILWHCYLAERGQSAPDGF